MIDYCSEKVEEEDVLNTNHGLIIQERGTNGHENKPNVLFLQIINRTLPVQSHRNYYS